MEKIVANVDAKKFACLLCAAVALPSLAYVREDRIGYKQAGEFIRARGDTLPVASDYPTAAYYSARRSYQDLALNKRVEYGYVVASNPLKFETSRRVKLLGFFSGVMVFQVISQ